MPGQPAEDHQLLKQAQQGDAEAFGALYERHSAAIFRYLYVHLSSRSDAEDLTSEVFLRAWQSLPRYRQRGVPFRAFLFRIAHNALVDQYRQGQRTHRLIQEDDPGHPADLPKPDDILIGEMNRQELSRLLAGLRDDYRTVLVLRFLSQLSPVETAAVMQRTPGAVRILQHRALEALRQKLLEQEADNI